MSEPAPPRVVVTRSVTQADDLARLLAEAGFAPLVFPVIAFAALPPAPLDAALLQLASYDWLLFTSVNAVTYFFERAAAPAIERADIRIAAVGSATAAGLARHGLKPDFVPPEFTAAHLAHGLGNLTGQHLLLPRARQGRPEITALLRENGAQVDDIPLYDTVTATPAPEALAALSAGFEAITFTSPSSVRNYFKIIGGQAAVDASRLRQVTREAAVACIGPVTASEAAGCGLTHPLVPETYTIAGLVHVLQEHFTCQ